MHKKILRLRLTLLQKQKRQKGDIEIVLIGIIVLGAVFLAGGYTGYFQQSAPSTPNPINATPVIQQSSAKNSLQLKTITFVTPTPTPTLPPTQPPVTAPSTTPSVNKPPPANPRTPQPGQPCAREGPIINGCVCNTSHLWIVDCENGKNVYPGTYPPTLFTDDICEGKQKQGESNGKYCVDKPVIYLYPTKPTLVSVKLTTPGSVVVSNPQYNTTTGWQQIEAHPDGTLLYQEKQYKELFYETSVNTVNAPNSGRVIPSSQLRTSLQTITAQLGLLPNEQQEFIDYWIPTLQALHSPYILFSILTPEEKDRIDHVDISPKPDIMIEFIAYFKPLSSPFTLLKPLILPPTPKRKGFTAVEWGGTIDTHSYLTSNY